MKRYLCSACGVTDATANGFCTRCSVELRFTSRIDLDEFYLARREQTRQRASRRRSASRRAEASA